MGMECASCPWVISGDDEYKDRDRQELLAEFKGLSQDDPTFKKFRDKLAEWEAGKNANQGKPGSMPQWSVLRSVTSVLSGWGGVGSHGLVGWCG